MRKRFCYITFAVVLVLFLFSACKSDVENENSDDLKIDIDNTNEESISLEIDVDNNDENAEDVYKTNTVNSSEFVFSKDENTRIITINFSEEIFDDTYDFAPIVSQSEFEYGEYVPFVRYAEGDGYAEAGSAGSMPFYSYAFLTEDTESLNDGKEIHKKLNSEFLVQNNLSEEDLPCVHPFFFSENDKDRALEFYNNSRVIYVSEDAKTVGNFMLIPNENKEESVLIPFSHYKYQIYRDGKNVETLIKETGEYYESYMDGGILSGDNWGTRYSYVSEDSPAYKVEVPYAERIFVNNNSNAVMFADSEHFNGGKLYICSPDEKRMVYEITMPTMAGSVAEGHYKVEQLIDSRFLLISLMREFPVNGRPHKANYLSILYDLENGTYEILEDCVSNPVISPDGKYMAFIRTIANKEGFGYSTLGFFIKNLETQKYLYYDYANTYGADYLKCGIVGWVSEEGLFKLIGE
ncbi:MAG: hypothetical protein E7600_06255 [Ruminococcaceae bacterium]|nr:hypothetical protein [Oscillospiraceae bacterium]